MHFHPCRCASRLPARSIDGASRHVQVARRAPVCCGNRLPVALFPGKSTHSAAAFTHVADLGGGKKRLASTCFFFLLRSRRRVLATFFFFFFPTSAFTETADGCKICAEPEDVVLKRARIQGMHMFEMSVFNYSCQPMLYLLRCRKSLSAT